MTDEVYILRARIAQLEAERQWRPIEHAPKGRAWLALLDYGGYWKKGRWSLSQQCWMDEFGDRITAEITHFMEMPAPPPITSET